MEYRTRKPIRLENYDYSRNGAYFVTVCTKNKQHLFWESQNKYLPIESDSSDVGAHSVRPSNYRQLCGQMQTTAPANTKQNKL